jgi:hypothetical protein
MKRRGFISGLGQVLGAACGGAALVAQASSLRRMHGDSLRGGEALFADGYEGPGFITDLFSVTGFGSKASLPYFEDFEAYAPGAAVSPVGRIQLSNSNGQTISTARAFHGTRSLQNLYSTNDFPKDYLVLSGQRPRFYFCCHLYYSGALTGSHVWKQGRIGSGDVYGGVPRAGESWTASSSLPQGFGGEIVNSDGITSWSEHNAATPNAEAVYGLDRWMFYEFEHYSGTVNNADSLTRATVDGVPVLIWNQRPYLTSATPTLPEWFLTVINGLDGSPPVTVNMDLVYADESRARIVFTNAANYGASSLFNLQPLVSYTDTQIVTQRITPSFALGETVHVHAWTDAGAYHYLGTRLLGSA